MSRRIAVIGDDAGWHSAQLRAAFAARGCEARLISLKRCGFDLDTSPFGVQLPGFAHQLPDGVFVRGVPSGSLEEIVLYLDVLHALRELGIEVYNDARAIERTVDKCMTSFVLKRAGIPTPPSWVYSDIEQARAIVRREIAAGHELVFKPLFGNQGTGLQRINHERSLPDHEACHGVYYLQRFVDTGEGRWHDWRIFVIDDEAVAAMRREGSTWISNVANGGRCQPAVLDGALRTLAEDAVRNLDMHYAGVDILRDTKGQYWVVEVNSIPAWKGLQSTCNLRISESLVDDFLRCCDNQMYVGVAG